MTTTIGQTILVIGAADTGRAPMAAALLLRLLEQHGHSCVVGSAGVLGHDGAPAEIEARETMTHMGLSIDDHQARSLSDDLLADAALLLVIDSGTALVVRARFPEAASRIHILGTLANRPRDIPDPFRMQFGAWITYAREIAALLEAALPRITAMLRAPEAMYGQPAVAAGGAAHSEGQLPAAADPRSAAAERIAHLLRMAAEMPDVLDWAAARGRIEADLGAVAAAPRNADDLVAAYAGLLRAALAMTPAAPAPGQLAALRAAAGCLPMPVGQAEINELSARLGTWATL
ncbi:MAG: protein tyrosine phosphatase [Roseiflexaceae bacterium]